MTTKTQMRRLPPKNIIVRHVLTVPHLQRLRFKAPRHSAQEFVHRFSSW